MHENALHTPFNCTSESNRIHSRVPPVGGDAESGKTEVKLNIDFVTDEPRTFITAIEGEPPIFMNEDAPIPAGKRVASEVERVKKVLPDSQKGPTDVAKAPTKKATKIPKRDNSKEKKSSISSVSSEESKSKHSSFGMLEL